YSGFSTSHNISIDEANGMLYAEGTTSKPVRAISLADPLNPVQLSTFGVYCHDIYASNHRLYVAEGTYGTVGIYDVSNPQYPTLLQRFPIPASGYVHNTWANDSHQYLVTTEETPGKTVKLWDIRNLNNVTLTDQYLASPGGMAHNAHIKGDYVYISHYTDGLRILDISDPNNIFEAGYYDTYSGPNGTYDGAWGAYPFFRSGKVLISDIETGLYIVFFPGAVETVPVINSSPDSFNVNLTEGDSESRQLSIENVGTAPLTWQISTSNKSSPLNFHNGSMINNLNYGKAPGAKSGRSIPGWLSISPQSGTLLPGDSQQVTFTFNASNLVSGAYSTTLNLLSNDPNVSSKSILCKLNVLPATMNHTMTLIDGWNLLGLPVDTGNRYYLYLFPGALPGSIWGFDGYYFSEDSLDLGRGYWLRYLNPAVINFQGLPLTSLTINLRHDWNLIAGLSTTLNIDEISDPDGILIPGTFFGFSGAYYQADSLEPGQGYWVRTNMAGQIVLGNGSQTNNSITKTFFDNIDLDKYPQIRISDSRGASQTLYLQVKLNRPGDKIKYSLPPLPPKGAFDARFADDYRIVTGNDATIKLQASKYPLKITFSNMENHESGYVLDEIIDGEVVTTHTVQGGESLVITDASVKQINFKKIPSLARQFSVMQNYPNPFNPTTVIRYSIPRNSFVDISIYNTLGQKIKSLVAEKQEAGEHQVEWDATDDWGIRVSSGIFFYRVTFGEQSVLKKMILMK
ncbi:MAG: choice-of-anchor B family protein, partial [Calditrichia bacterium]